MVTQGSAGQWRCMGQRSADVTRIRAMGRRGDNPSHAWVFSVTESQRLRAAGLCHECEDHRYDLSHRWLSRAFLAAERLVPAVTGSGGARARLGTQRHTQPRIPGRPSSPAGETCPLRRDCAGFRSLGTTGTQHGGRGTRRYAVIRAILATAVAPGRAGSQRRSGPSFSQAVGQCRAGHTAIADGRDAATSWRPFYLGNTASAPLGSSSWRAVSTRICQRPGDRAVLIWPPRTARQ